MEPRRKLILIIVAVLLFVAALLLVWYLFFRNAGNAPAPTDTISQEGTITTGGLESAPARNSTSTPISPAALPPSPPPKQPDAIRTAEVFAERYGSYSNQELAFQNLRDLLPIMSARYRSETEARIGTSGQANPNATYQGVTSAKISSTVVTESEIAAKIDVALQQTASGTSGSQVTYRTLHVSLVKEGDAWLVDSVAWAN